MLQDCIPSLKRYVEDRIETGGFLRAVLENNLMEAFGRADASNREDLFNICSYVYNEMPASCHGNRDKVEKWLAGSKLRDPDSRS